MRQPEVPRPLAIAGWVIVAAITGTLCGALVAGGWTDQLLFWPFTWGL